MLFKKLSSRNCPSFAIRLLANWYSKQMFSVRWDESRSGEFRATNGVRQGGVMSPLLYNVYIDELNTLLSRSLAGCKLDECKINNISYADDMVLLAPSVTALQELIHICERYAVSHDIVYNAKKSKVMVMRKGRSAMSFDPPVQLNGDNLQVENDVTYLGHVLTHDCSDSKDIKRQYRSLCARSNTTIRKFAQCSEAVKIKLFNAYCTNLYCLSLYQSFTKREMSTLRVCYNNAFRRLLGLRFDCSASDMFLSRNTLTFGELQRKSNNSIRDRIATSPNALVRTVLSVAGEGVLAERWRSLLYL